MLRPVRMTLVDLMLLKEDEACVLRELGLLECLHVRSTHVHKTDGSMAELDTREAVSAIEGLRSRLDQLSRDLGIRHYTQQEAEPRIDPKGIAATIEAELAPLEREVVELVGRVSQGQKVREKADLVAWTIAGLENAGIDTDVVVRAKYVAVELGALPTNAFPRVRDSFALAGHKVFRLGSLGGRTLVCAVTEPERRQDLADALDAARFDRILIGKELIFDGRSAADLNEEAMWEVRENLTEAGLALTALARKHAPLIARWRREIEVNSKLLDAMEMFLEGSYTCLMGGWVPSEMVDGLAERISRACAGPVEVIPVAERTQQAHEGHEEHSGPPTLLRNNAFVRPFQILVTFFGSPAYNGIDPTTFVAFTFSILFGAMFGDAGQGAILALTGLALRQLVRSELVRDAGAILASCGTCSVIFGLIYGSVFGFEYEHMSILGFSWKTLPPMGDPATFLMGGVIVGAIVINLGLVINLAQHLWARNYRDALFGEWGGSTLLFYWGVCGLFYLSATGKGGGLTPGVIAAVLGPPLLATTFGSELYDLIARRKGRHEMAGLFVRPMELMMGSLSNTMSFMRVSAFAMNHAALMGTVFVFANMLGGQDPSGVGKVVWGGDVIIGNIMVMCLEGVMVFVQVLRLHYYEFFSKFFHHQGRPFEPLTLRAGRSNL